MKNIRSKSVSHHNDCGASRPNLSNHAPTGVVKRLVLLVALALPVWGAVAADAVPHSHDSDSAQPASPGGGDTSLTLQELQRLVVQQGAQLKALEGQLHEQTSSGPGNTAAQASDLAPPASHKTATVADSQEKSSPAPAPGNTGGVTSAPVSGVVSAMQPASSAPGQGQASGGTSDMGYQRSYASGVSLGREILMSLQSQKAVGISLEPDVLLQGITDAVNGTALRMPDSLVMSTLNDLQADVNARTQIRRTEEVSRGREFRATFRKQKGVVSDAGSLYLVSAKGSTPHLRTTDLATLKIRASLPDGTVFDGSGDAGQTRQIKVGAMLPAVAIGLQKVGVGGRITIVVPPEKAYGDMGLPPAIPGGATLIFDITVQGVNEGG